MGRARLHGRRLPAPSLSPHNRPSMRQLRIGLAQINATVGDIAGNVARVTTRIDEARRLGVDVLAFPEMCITGYPPEDLLLKPSFIDRAIQAAQDLAPLTAGEDVAVGTAAP